MYMKDWLETIDDYLKMTRRDILTNSGRISHKQAKAPSPLEKVGWGLFSFIPIQHWQEHQGCGICFLQHQN